MQPKTSTKKSRTLRQGIRVGRIVPLNRTTYKVLITVTAIIGDRTYWNVHSPEKKFQEFRIITDSQNKFTVNIYSRNNRPNGLLAEAICLILNELWEYNRSETPSFHLRAVNHYLFDEFSSAGFKKDKNKPETTMVCINW